MSLAELNPAEKLSLRRRLNAWHPTFRPALLLAWLTLGIVFSWALFPGWFTGWSSTEGIAGAQRMAPQAEHWLGTDQLGRDLYARIVWGASHSLSGAAIAVVLGLTAGTLIGVVAATSGKRSESLLMRLVDVLLAIPGLLLALSVIILLGFGTLHAAIAVGITSIAHFARLAHGEVVRIRHAEYVEAARGSGATWLAILRRHILPNALTPVLAFSALQFGHAILAISTLSFLGYGTPPPTPEWGLLIAEGRNYLATAWWLTTFPGIVVVTVVLATNYLSRYYAGGR